MRIHGQMYFGVEPPFVRPIAWFPPRAPVASGCTLTWLASIISHSKSVSSTSASRIFSQIPLSRHRQNRRCTFFQFPYVSGKSRQGAPVRKIQNTPLINCRVSRALPPRVPFSPIVYGLIFSQALSLISCRCCSLAIFLPPASFGDYYNTPLLTTPSSSNTRLCRFSCTHFMPYLRLHVLLNSTGAPSEHYVSSRLYSVNAVLSAAPHCVCRFSNSSSWPSNIDSAFA